MTSDPKDGGPVEGRLQAGSPGEAAADAALEAILVEVEAERRAGAAEAAVERARDALVRHPECLELRVALALALLDAGRLGEAHRELEASLAARSAQEDAAESPPPLDPVTLMRGAGGPAEEPELELEALADDELDDAFERAVPDAEEVVDADRIAQEAMRAARLEAPEDVITHPGSPFATQTVARLLETQGDVRGAESVRAALAARQPSAPAAAMPEGPLSEAAARRRQWIGTLERWLENLRRGRR